MSSPRKAPTESTLSFEEYASIPPQTPFSNVFLRAITFNDLRTFGMPTIAPPGTVHRWVHTEDVPTDWEFGEDDVIPYLEDLGDMLKEMEAEYAKGYRGVTMQLRVYGKEFDYTASYRMVRTCVTSTQGTPLTLHFEQLRLFRNANNYHKRIANAGRLLDTLQNMKSFPEDSLDSLGSHSISADVAGLCDSGCPLWELGYLLDKAWVCEEALNVLSEITYFHHAATSNNSPPNVLILPT
ncbi:hypothetical protein SCHPADRAFT_828695, partial [Schizopora paradoxa]